MLSRVTYRMQASMPTAKPPPTAHPGSVPLAPALAPSPQPTPCNCSSGRQKHPHLFSSTPQYPIPRSPPQHTHANFLTPNTPQVLVRVTYAGVNGGCETFRARGEYAFAANRGLKVRTRGWTNKHSSR